MWSAVPTTSDHNYPERSSLAALSLTALEGSLFVWSYGFMDEPVVLKGLSKYAGRYPVMKIRLNCQIFTVFFS